MRGADGAVAAAPKAVRRTGAARIGRGCLAVAVAVITIQQKLALVISALAFGIAFIAN